MNPQRSMNTRTLQTYEDYNQQRNRRFGLPYIGDAHVGEGAAQSTHFAFWREDFWIERSWALASSTGMSAAILR